MEDLEYRVLAQKYGIMRYWVYVHTCPNGKKYVGCTTQENPERRWCKGKGYIKNEHFYRAIQKYSWENIQHEVFEVDSKEKMYKEEARLITLYDSSNFSKGYNNNPGGENHTVSWNKGKTLGPFTEERKSKISRALKGKAKSFSHCLNISKGKKGSNYYQSTEYRQKISESAQKRSSNPEWRRKQSESHKGIGRGIPKPKYKYLLPDGTTKEMSLSSAKRWYTNRGIEIVKVN